MRTYYETYKLTIPANTLLLTPALTARPDALPFITSLGRTTSLGSDFFFFVNDSEAVNIPHEFTMGYGDFLPFFYQMKENDLTRGGFKSHDAAERDFYFTIQYYYPD